MLALELWRQVGELCGVVQSQFAAIAALNARRSPEQQPRRLSSWNGAFADASAMDRGAVELVREQRKGVGASRFRAPKQS